MQIILLSPNWQTCFSNEDIQKLKTQGEVICIDQIKPFPDVAELKTQTDKVIAIDPDFCNWQVTKNDLESMVNVKAVALQSTSFSWIDHQAAKDLGIVVVNCRNWCTVAVAEWAIMLMLILARKAPVFIRNGWQQDFGKHQGMELRGKIVGVIGMGNIGKAFAENVHGLGLKVQYWSKHATDHRFSKVDLETLMKTSDIIFPAVAQNDETSGLLTDELLKSMKKSAIFISIVHQIYNHELLVDMVKKGDLFGYGFENNTPVFTQYDGNIWAGPELTWCTNESLRSNSEVWLSQILEAAKGNYPNIVNK